MKFWTKIDDIYVDMNIGIVKAALVGIKGYTLADSGMGELRSGTKRGTQLQTLSVTVLWGSVQLLRDEVLGSGFLKRAEELAFGRSYRMMQSQVEDLRGCAKQVATAKQAAAKQQGINILGCRADDPQMRRIDRTAYQDIGLVEMRAGLSATILVKQANRILNLFPPSKIHNFELTQDQ